MALIATGQLAGHSHAFAQGAGPRVSMCDWTFGSQCDPEIIPRAKEVNLDGIQVSVESGLDRIPLRETAVRRRFLELGKRHGIAFHSVAAGLILNRIPLKSEPESAVYVVDAVEAAAALGAKNVMLAFFGAGDLRLRDARGEFRNVSDGPFHSYVLDTVGTNRVVQAVKQIVPRAEEAGIILGLENTLSAEQNLEIIDRIGSEMVQVYYDVGNSTRWHYDVPGEIRMLGNDRICELHIKDIETRVLGATGGVVDFKGIAEACRAIGYDKWYVIETRGRENHFEEDTRANVTFVQRTFA